MRSLFLALRTKLKTQSRVSLTTKLVILSALALLVWSISIPNLLRSRIAANEASAVGSLRTLNTALVSYSSDHPGEGFPHHLADLQPYIDPVLASGQKSGYTFRYRPATPDFDGVVRRYRVEAQPIAASQTGQRRFSANETGVINYQLGGAEQSLGGETMPPPLRQAVREMRKVVTKAELSLIVGDPAAAAEKVRSAASRFGGYIESMRSSDVGGGARQMSLSVRIPAAHFDDARRAIKMIGDRVTSEEDDARDVTSQYVDLESNLRNYHAEEAQYLEIMQRSGSIKDTLAVAERLADVRGRIERTQGQLNLMSHQAAMATLEVTLSSEAVVQPVDVRWHPRAQIKAALSEAADDLATYADFLIAVLVRLPVFALWAVTLLAAVVTGWRLLRWVRRRWFAPALPAA